MGKEKVTVEKTVLSGGGFHCRTPRLTARHTSTLNSRINELKYDTLTCEYPGLAAKYEYYCSKISN